MTTLQTLVEEALYYHEIEVKVMSQSVIWNPGIVCENELSTEKISLSPFFFIFNLPRCHQTLADNATLESKFSWGKYGHFDLGVFLLMNVDFGLSFYTQFLSFQWKMDYGFVDNQSVLLRDRNQKINGKKPVRHCMYM